MKKKLFTLIALFLPMMASAQTSGTRAVGAENIGLIINNYCPEDIYTTGHIYIAVGQPGTEDWGPINIDIDPVTDGYAGYRIPAGQTAVIPASQLNITVNSKDPGEVVSKYYYGPIYSFIYCRVYSWTGGHDPLVLQCQCASSAFIPGGYVEMNVVSIKHDEGVMYPGPAPITLGGGGSVTPIQPQPDPEPQVNPEPDPEPQVNPEPEPEPEPQVIPEPEPEVDLPQCEAPTIDYTDGILTFASKTEDVSFFYTITVTPTNGRSEGSVDLSDENLTLTVVVQASKWGYKDSEETIQEFPLIGVKGIKGDLNGDGVVNAADHVELTNIIMNEAE